MLIGMSSYSASRACRERPMPDEIPGGHLRLPPLDHRADTRRVNRAAPLSAGVASLPGAEGGPWSQTHASFDQGEVLRDRSTALVQPRRTQAAFFLWILAVGLAAVWIATLAIHWNECRGPSGAWVLAVGSGGSAAGAAFRSLRDRRLATAAALFAATLVGVVVTIALSWGRRDDRTLHPTSNVVRKVPFLAGLPEI
jgi:hypothetical protein